jgi:hypothetical protein
MDINFFNLNQVWIYIGITEFSFLNFLKIIFFIAFLLVNLSLLYLEYLDKKNNNNNKEKTMVMQKGMGAEVKKICTSLITGLGVYSAILTIKNENRDRLREQKEREAFEIAQNEVRKLKDQNSSNNLIQRIHIDNINKNYNNLDTIRDNRSEVEKAVLAERDKVKWDTDTKNDPETNLVLLRLTNKLKELDRQETTELKDLAQNIKKAQIFAHQISKQEDEVTILDMLNAKKSSVFNLDEIWTNFESLSGLLKVANLMIFSNCIILWCLFGVILNLYGDYLLDRFNLAEKYPRVALIINYRRKLSKYYILSNLFLIISMCVLNIILGVSILSISL